MVVALVLEAVRIMRDMVANMVDFAADEDDPVVGGNSPEKKWVVVFAAAAAVAVEDEEAKGDIGDASVTSEDGCEEAGSRAEKGFEPVLLQP
ncbi:hypothetical protein BGZ70_002548 [Mortierella alpina]|uniref:Uncharacterized protein n=1 Tax=Mortierella alpina TaxID=64518 RepID=A0A9P6LWY7_MORAP|nr:hypothetical protein BGZ70_002548 [Mortierella alpina]